MVNEKNLEMEQVILNKINKNIKNPFKSINEIDNTHNENISPLDMFIFLNKKTKFELLEEEVSYLIRESNLNNKDITGRVPLQNIFELNTKNSLHISDKNFEYLIKNTDLKTYDIKGENPLISAIINSITKDNNFNFYLKNEYWMYMIENSNLSQIAEFDNKKYTVGDIIFKDGCEFYEPILQDNGIEYILCHILDTREAETNPEIILKKIEETKSNSDELLKKYNTRKTKDKLKTLRSNTDNTKNISLNKY